MGSQGPSSLSGLYLHLWCDLYEALASSEPQIPQLSYGGTQQGKLNSKGFSSWNDSEMIPQSPQTLINTAKICLLTRKGSDEVRAGPLSPDVEGLSLGGGAGSAQGAEGRSRAATRHPRRERDPHLWGCTSRASL